VRLAVQEIVSYSIRSILYRPYTGLILITNVTIACPRKDNPACPVYDFFTDEEKDNSQSEEGIEVDEDE
jgi:hypothetical protein